MCLSGRFFWSGDRRSNYLQRIWVADQSERPLWSECVWWVCPDHVLPHHWAEGLDRCFKSHLHITQQPRSSDAWFAAGKRQSEQQRRNPSSRHDVTLLSLTNQSHWSSRKKMRMTNILWLKLFSVWYDWIFEYLMTLLQFSLQINLLIKK